LSQTGSAKWENKPISRLQFRLRLLISCRVNYTLSRRAPFQVKEGAIANALVFSRDQPCWNVCRNILARFVWWPFKSTVPWKGLPY
jgi:hypothetical protein